MPNSLSRIEREYILKTLAELLPPLTLQQGSFFMTIEGSSYRVSGDKIDVNAAVCGFIDKSMLCVYFRHKDRALYFDSAIFPDGSGSFSLHIPGDVFKVADESRAGGMRLLISSFEPALEVRESASFPLDVVFIDPLVCTGREAVFDRLTARIGLHIEKFRNSPLAYRLYEYVDNFRTGGAKLRFSPTIVYVDSALALVSVPKPAFARLKKNETIQVSLMADARRIDCASEIRGTMSLNAESGLLLLDLSGAQLEDKRFLHERLFRNKYQGQGQ